jgi:hypothetical protein
MSNVIAPYTPKWEDFSFATPFESSDNWHFSYDDGKSLEKTLSAVFPFGAIVLFFLLFSRYSPLSGIVSMFNNEFVGGAAYLGIFLGMVVGSYFVASKLAKRTIASRNRKRDEFRAEHAAAVIDELGKKGWTIYGNDVVATLLKDNNPYLLNEHGVRYYARQFHVGRENVSFMVELSDEAAEQGLKDKEKQSRLDFLIKRYEDANGAMSPEKKAGFEAALKMSL